MKHIPLSQGKYSIVDDEDYEWLSQWKWHFNHHGYAVRNGYKNDKRRKILMHRAIMNAPENMQIDHINHDTLDNRRSNLRIVTNSQNSWNQKRRRDGTSRYKGVSWYKASKKWHAKIQLHGKRKHLGYFHCEHEAARAYDKAALEMFGEFALTNFPAEKYR